MQGMFSNPATVDVTSDAIVVQSYEIADAMIAARKEQS
jgi:hypothetical protein